jgi:hypothetical protein
MVMNNLKVSLKETVEPILTEIIIMANVQENMIYTAQKIRLKNYQTFLRSAQ